MVATARERTLPRGPLRWRLALAYAVVLAVMLGIVLFAAGAVVERALIDTTATRLQVEAGLIVNEASGARAVTATDLAATDLASVLGGQETAVVVLDGDGTLLATDSNLAPDAVIEARLRAEDYRAVVAGGQAAQAVVAGVAGTRVLVVAVPVQLRSGAGEPVDRGRPGDKGPPPGRGRGLGNGNSDNAGTGDDGAPNAVAQLAVSLEHVDATLADLRSTLLLIGLAVFGAGLAFAWFVTSAGLMPLRRVARVADRVAAGDLTARAHLPSGHDEIGRLGRAFDDMVERVEITLRSQRQFAADASHELRSPLTVLGGYVDVLARSGLAATDEGQRTLAAMRREIDRLSRLAADLLLLSQLEAGVGSLEPRELDLGELVEDVGEAARVIADGRRVEVARNGPVRVVADRDRLTQALMNLVGNAVRHTPQGGVIELSAHREGPSAVATVANDGDAIEPAHLPHLFERFYRVRAAESAERPGDHAGLGLAIVKAIAEASGGSVGVTSHAGSTRFEMRLPAAPA